MDFSNFWWQATGEDPGPGPGPGPNHPIGQSLRFRPNGFLARGPINDPTPTTYTLSAWIKRTKNRQETHFALSRVHPDGSPMHWLGSFWFDDILGVREGSDSAISFNGALYRDPAAWMHIVYAFENGTITCWVNGEQVGTSNVLTAFLKSGDTFYIGSEGGNAGVARGGIERESPATEKQRHLTTGS